jgi:hypothetical protein
VIRVRKRHEASWKNSLFADFVRAHLRQLLPGHTSAEFNAHAHLDRFTARHCHPGCGLVAQIVPFFQKRQLPLHDAGLRRAHPLHDTFKVFLNHHGHVARRLLPVLCQNHSDESGRDPTNENPAQSQYHFVSSS